MFAKNNNLILVARNRERLEQIRSDLTEQNKSASITVDVNFQVGRCMPAFLICSPATTNNLREVRKYLRWHVHRLRVPLPRPVL
nr:hypothetical protein [Paenibacillus sp. VKM B-2647]